MNAWSLPMYSHLRFTIFKSDLYHIIDLAPACTYRSITNIYAAATIWNKQAISIQNRTGWVRSPQEFHFVASPSSTLNSSWKKNTKHRSEISARSRGRVSSRSVTSESQITWYNTCFESCAMDTLQRFAWSHCSSSAPLKNTTIWKHQQSVFNPISCLALNTSKISIDNMPEGEKHPDFDVYASFQKFLEDNEVSNKHDPLSDAYDSAWEYPRFHHH